MAVLLACGRNFDIGAFCFRGNGPQSLVSVIDF
jgi:hypothetical protein